MPALPSTVAVDCPRCDDKIHCTLDVQPAPAKPGTKPAVAASITDLADRFADHYREAGHA